MYNGYDEDEKKFGLKKKEEKPKARYLIKDNDNDQSDDEIILEDEYENK